MLRTYARTRVLIGFGAGGAGFAVAMGFLPWQVAILIGWNVAALVIVGWVVLLVLRCDGTATSTLSVREDESRFIADVLQVGACLVSLVAVGFSLIKAANEKGLARAATTGNAVLGVLLAWAVVHSVYTLRYAHLYYLECRGVDFNQGEDPDYRDFAYLALTVGMTYQVSDTDLTTKVVRHTVTKHALLSYLFGTVIVAMMINVVAGLLK